MGGNESYFQVVVYLKVKVQNFQELINYIFVIFVFSFGRKIL